MKITVCKGCGCVMGAKDEESKPACVICYGLNPDNSIPIEVELPNELKCIHCKRVKKTEELLKNWRGNIPFCEPERGLYYCGCRGWD